MTEKPAEVALGAPAAVVLAGDAPPALVERLSDQLRELAGPVVVIAGLHEIAQLASQGRGPLVIADGDIAVHGEALANLIHDPRPGTLALAGSATRAAHPIEARGGRIVSAGSAVHRVGRRNGTFLGVLRVGADDLGALAAVAEQVAPFAGDDRPWPAGDPRGVLGGDDHVGPGDPRGVLGGDDFVGPDDEQRVVAAGGDPRVAGASTAAMLLVGLVRSGTPVRPVYLRRLGWTRGEAGVAALDAADEDRLQLDSSVKGYDSPFTAFLVSPYSRHVARWAARRGLTPNQVTVASLLIGILAAAAFATGERGAMIAGAVLLLVAFVTDCVDGQLARYTRTYSKLGAWLDSVFDRTKEYLAYAGLAIGAGADVWLLACAALTLQTVRHFSDFAFAAAHRPAATELPLDQPLDRPAAPQASSLAAWRRADRSGAVRWLKRALPFPIGERFAVIALTAALFTPEVTFIALLTGGVIGLAYTHAGRLLRSRSHRWLSTPLACAIESGGLVGIAAVHGPDAYPAAFALLGVLAFHHYDVNLRSNQAGWVGAMASTWVVLLVAAALLLAGALPAGFFAAAAILAVAFLADAARGLA